MPRTITRGEERRSPMDPARFDQLSKRVATRLTRRRVVRALGTAAVAGAVLSQRHQDAAADCPNAAVTCGIITNPVDFLNVGGYGSAGEYAQCWNWSTLVCELCRDARSAAIKRCNATWPECQGRCYAMILSN
jgi:hypothetical protein